MLRFPLVGLAFAAISAAAAWAAPAASDVIARDGVEITILPRIGPATGPDTVDVELDVEARTDDAAHRLGFHSLRAAARVDCRVGANLVLAAETFDGVGLSGLGHPRAVSNAWVRPTADSYMSEVTQRVCAAADGAPSAQPATMRVTLGSGADPAPPTATAVAPAAGVGVTPARSVASAARIAATPTHMRIVAPAAGVAIPPIPAGAHAITLMPAVLAPAAPAAVAPATAQRLAAQVAAEGTAEDAQKVLDGLGALIAPPLTGSVQLALVQHAHFYRASVSGFASAAEARAFCARAAHVTRQCWVRPEPAPQRELPDAAGR